MKITCKQFFDGFKLYGPTILSFDDNGIVIAIDNSIDNNNDIVNNIVTYDYDLITPGFVDLQVNGYDKYEIETKEEILNLNNELAKKGTTSWLATYVTAPLDELKDKIINIYDDRILGFHLEGPFIGNCPGAHRTEYIIPVDINWIKELPSSVKLVTLAPEQKNVIEGIQQLTKQDISVSLGHSMPTKDEYEQAVKSGASMLTHLYNAMSGIHHRNDGLALFGLTDDRVYCGIIADLVHVTSDAIRLAFLSKPSKIYLVSDSIAWTSANAKRKEASLINGAVRFEKSGVLIGSASTMADMVRNCVQICNIPLEIVLKSATSIPANLINLPINGKHSTAGRIVIGKCCPINCLNKDLIVENVLFI